MKQEFGYNYCTEDIEARVDGFLNSLPCQSSTPFPPVEVEREDKDYAILLYNVYANSRYSEIQAITQYIYHKNTIENETVANTLLCIALIEMGHLGALAELIRQLGDYPFYVDSREKEFTTKLLAYIDKLNIFNPHKEKACEGKVIREKLEADICAEKAAIEGYNKLIKEIKDKKIVAVLCKILQDEIVHVEILTKLIKDFC